MNRRRWNVSRGRAYTLIELLVVLAVLAAVAGAALPLLRKPLAKSSVVSAAQQLSDDLGTARLWAIEYGAPILFSFEPGGAAYRVRPLGVEKSIHTSETATIQTGAVGPGATGMDGMENEPEPVGTAPNSTIDSVAQDGFLEGSLNENVRFKETPAPDRTTRDVNAIDPLADTGQNMALFQASLPAEDTATDWATESETDIETTAKFVDAVVFFQDGRSTKSRFDLVGDGYQLAITMRGITGGVQISEPKALPPPVDESEALTSENAVDPFVDPFIDKTHDETIR